MEPQSSTAEIDDWIADDWDEAGPVNTLSMVTTTCSTYLHTAPRFARELLPQFPLLLLEIYKF